jgi:RNA polymerase sigma-70 factor (ECF subfamily)
LTDEQTLLRGARSLDGTSLGTVFDTYYPLLYRYIYHHTGHQATAEDLTAEVFKRLLEQLANDKGPDRHLRAWLYRVAHNLVVDEARRRVHRDHEPLDREQAAARQDVETSVQAALLKRQARAALEELTPKQRAVIILKYLEGYDNREVARMLDISVGAAKSLQHRALAAMRKKLAATGVVREDLP